MACKHYCFLKKFKFPDSGQAEQFQELCNAAPELEKLKQDYHDLFSLVSSSVRHDVYRFISTLNTKIVKNAELISVEELSEIVQNFYQVFAKRMEANSIYAGITDFKHVVYSLFYSFLSVMLLFTIACSNKIGKVYSLEHTNILEVFIMLHDTMMMSAGQPGE